MSGGVGLNELIPMSGEDKKAAASNLAKFLDLIFRTDRILGPELPGMFPTCRDGKINPIRLWFLFCIMYIILIYIYTFKICKDFHCKD